MASARDAGPADIAACCRRLFLAADAMGWRSYDPHDFLAAPLFRRVPRVSRLLARALVQAGRRTGAHPRRLLRIAPHEEPKALADFLSAAVLWAGAGQEWAHQYLRPLSARLLGAATRTAHGRGWGLSFPYANRFTSVEAGVPNVYITLTAVRALLDSYALTGDASLRDAALDGVNFITDDLGMHCAGGRAWVRYWPGADDCIVNVQALTAGMLARAAPVVDRPALAEQGDQLAATVVATQTGAGAWRYSEDGRAGFVDGFHTGFVLQGLSDYLAHRGEAAAPDAAAAVRTGFQFFKGRLLGPDGAPLGFAGGRPSHDGQTLAQAIQTLSLCAAGADDLRLAWRVWDRYRCTRSLRPLLLPGAHSSAGRSHLPSLRWTAGPAVLAIAHLDRAARRWSAGL